MEKDDRPKSGDLVIWDMEPDHIPPRYWVRTQSRGSDTQLFEGPDAWDRACSAARERAGPEGTIWKRHKDGHFEKVWGQRCPSPLVPIRYELDDLRRRVVVTVEGPFQTDDILAIMARQRAEQTWTYGMLYDLRGMTGEPTIAELRELMSKAAELRGDEGPRGPVALLATDETLYRRLCVYAALGRSTTLTIEVFRDRAEAEEWLTARAKK